jgi:UDP-N-acetylmuramoyl-L-alanyl-D-glutamate--2,6-diaminopimelate ligase
MRTRQILSELEFLKYEGDLDLEVTGLASDSKEVRAGDIFCAVRGHVHDGHEFAGEARKRGAVLVVLEREVDGIEPPYLIVKDARKALARLAQAVYGHPSRDLYVVGITGTNGKTTTSYLVDAVLADRYRKTAVIGTLGIKTHDTEKHIGLTTPESLDLARRMRGFLAEGIQAVTMEVSSHSLALSRVDGIAFDVAVFTNITGDHLDFHKDFGNYLDMKLMLFRDLSSSGKDSRGVANLDDPASELFRKACAVPCLTFSLKDPQADVFVERYYLSTEGTSIIFITPYGRVECILSLLGRFNVQNAAAACAVGIAAGIPSESIVKRLESIKGLAGRFERIEGPGFDVVVDFAHTPDALENLLITARELAPKRIILVFGCGGDRDKSKRPLMGEIGARLADILFVTSDNPRSENPERILDDIEVGVRSVRRDFFRIASRRDAIDDAVKAARDGDMVLIAGKGHEDYQIIGKKKYPFDDKIEVLKALRKLDERE